jgi:hypothetical protein
MANFTANYDARNIYKTSFLDKNCVAKTPIDTRSTFFFRKSLFHVPRTSLLILVSRTPPRSSSPRWQVTRRFRTPNHPPLTLPFVTSVWRSVPATCARTFSSNVTRAHLYVSRFFHFLIRSRPDTRSQPARCPVPDSWSRSSNDDAH